MELTSTLTRRTANPENRIALETDMMTADINTSNAYVDQFRDDEQAIPSEESFSPSLFCRIPISHAYSLRPYFIKDLNTLNSTYLSLPCRPRLTYTNNSISLMTYVMYARVFCFIRNKVSYWDLIFYHFYAIFNANGVTSLTKRKAKQITSHCPAIADWIQETFSRNADFVVYHTHHCS